MQPHEAGIIDVMESIERQAVLASWLMLGSPFLSSTEHILVG